MLTGSSQSARIPRPLESYSTPTFIPDQLSSMSIVPPGGLVLVTGANGYIASVTIGTLLRHGYEVRGTVRSLPKHQWMKEFYGLKFSLIEVNDFTTDGAFNEAVKGVDGIAHMATDMRLDPQDTSIIESTTRAVINLLEAANAEPTVKRLVYTSSQGACVSSVPGVEYEINQDTYNMTAISQCQALCNGETLQDSISRGLLLYYGAKAQAEQQGFDWVLQHKPSFIFNTVVPNVNFGRVVSPKNTGFHSTAALVESVTRGLPIAPAILPSQWFVNVEDTALLHLAALTMDEVKTERLFAFSSPYSWKDILSILRRHYPEQDSILSPELVEETAVDIGKVDNSRSADLLRKLGKSGFTSLEETLITAMEQIIEAQEIDDIPKNRIDLMMASSRQ